MKVELYINGKTVQTELWINIVAIKIRSDQIAELTFKLILPGKSICNNFSYLSGRKSYNPNMHYFYSSEFDINVLAEAFDSRFGMLTKVIESKVNDAATHLIGNVCDGFEIRQTDTQIQELKQGDNDLEIKKSVEIAVGNTWTRTRNNVPFFNFLHVVISEFVSSNSKPELTTIPSQYNNTRYTNPFSTYFTTAFLCSIEKTCRKSGITLTIDKNYQNELEGSLSTVTKFFGDLLGKDITVSMSEKVNLDRCLQGIPKKTAVKNAIIIQSFFRSVPVTRTYRQYKKAQSQVEELLAHGRVKDVGEALKEMEACTTKLGL